MEAVKVINFPNEKNTLQTYINDFYEQYAINSKSTAVAYSSDVERFAKFLEHSGRVEDAKSVNIEVFARFYDYDVLSQFQRYSVNEANLQASSVNRVMTALKEFGRYMTARKVSFDVTPFSSLKNLKGSAKSYEVISIQEGITIAEWIRDNESNEPMTKYFYILMAIDTGVRADALSKLTPANFIPRESHTLVKGIDKGKKSFEKKISNDLYEELTKHLDFSDRTKPIFPITARMRGAMMKRALKGLNWEDRNIVFHSFKKCAVNYSYEVTGDIMIAKRVANHSSVSVTQTYINEGEDFMGAVSNTNAEKLKSLDFNDFSKEELVRAMQAMGDNTQYQLKAELLKD